MDTATHDARRGFSIPADQEAQKTAGAQKTGEAAKSAEPQKGADPSLRKDAGTALTAGLAADAAKMPYAVDVRLRCIDAVKALPGANHANAASLIRAAQEIEHYAMTGELTPAK